jgi:ribosomal protein S18 acetylase RimI-like enzyme
MNLRVINNENDEALAIVRPLYEESFKWNERRAWAQLLSLVNEPDMKLAIAEADLESTDGSHLREPVGFVIWWELGEWLYLEHFAVLPAVRGKQYGGQVVQLLKERASKLVLETSLPDSPENVRRIGFYERQGLVVNSFPYAQPPYRRAEMPVPMVLISSPTITDREEFALVTGLIRESVYERFYSQNNTF